MAAQKSAFICAIILLPLALLSAQEDRIRGPIDGREIVILKGEISPDVAMASDRGALQPWTPIHDVTLVLGPSPEQSAELDQLLEDQRDPSSGNYQRWLTPEEYGERFGVSDSDLGQITAWLLSQGFTVDKIARAKNWVTFSGTAGDFNRTFRTELHRYDSADGERHFANSTEPSVPVALGGVVMGMRGLNDFRPKPMVRAGTRPNYTTSSSTHYLAPDDFATIYDVAALFQAGYNGTGQKLAIAGQTDIALGDIRAFRAQFNLPAKDPQLVLTGADPGLHAGDETEADLDIEWSGAVARNATIVYVYSQNVFTSVQYAIDEDLAPVISMSYGACEKGAPASYRTMAQQANAEGITWMNASGDSAAAGCDAQGAKSATHGPAVTFPRTFPRSRRLEVPEFNEGSGTYWSSKNGANWGSALSYIPEKAWNDTPLGQGIEGTGGGASTLFPKPWWQTGSGVPNDGARDIPDVALAASAAHDGYIMYSTGSLMVVGGTSVPAPAFAGLIALLNQYLVAKGVQSKAGLGNINPTLYALAQGTGGAFHDVTTGDNIVPCSNGTVGCTSGSFGYKAGTGYDPVTGLGSVDAYKLAVNWNSVASSVGTTTTLVASPSTIAVSATSQLTATVKAVSGSNAPTGSVTFSAGNAALGSATLAPTSSTGTSASAVFSVKGSALTAGSNTITATYSAQGRFSSSSGTATLSVTVPPVATTTTVMANPTSLASTGSTQLTAHVVPAAGSATPTGTVTFAIGTTVLGKVSVTASANIAAAVLTVKGSSLAPGANNITASYAASGNFANSTSSVTVTVASSQHPIP